MAGPIRYRKPMRRESSKDGDNGRRGSSRRSTLEPDLELMDLALLRRGSHRSTRSGLEGEEHSRRGSHNMAKDGDVELDIIPEGVLCGGGQRSGTGATTGGCSSQCRKHSGISASQCTQDPGRNHGLDHSGIAVNIEVAGAGSMGCVELEGACPQPPGCLACLTRPLGRLSSWLLEVEMGFVWCVASLAIIFFIFASIWFIDPALLTMILQFQPANCTTIHSAYLIGISNCTWTSCRHGCTTDVYKCWQILVNFTTSIKQPPIQPIWNTLTSFKQESLPTVNGPQDSVVTKLYPNVRGCGYPPNLNCLDFFGSYGVLGAKFPCWVSHMDPSIAMTELNIDGLKQDVIYSLIPLAVFILFTLYAFCRLGVFAICNPFRCCPRPKDMTDTAQLTPTQLFRYKKTLMAKKAAALKAFQASDPDLPQLAIPATILEDVEIVEDVMEGVGRKVIEDSRGLESRENVLLQVPTVQNVPNKKLK